MAVRDVPPQLELIFDSVWEVIRPRGTLGPKAETQLRLSLARRLVILSTNDIIDARELRRQAIEHFMLGQQRNKTVDETFWSHD